MTQGRKNGVVVRHLEDGCSLSLKFVHKDPDLMHRLVGAFGLLGAISVDYEEQGLRVQMPFRLAAEQLVGLLSVSSEIGLVGEF